MEQFVIISLNTEKVGYYVFSKFVANRPQFNANHCLYNYKVYSSKSAAERTANRVRAYYRTMPTIITKVLSMQDWNNVQDSAQMEEFMLNN